MYLEIPFSAEYLRLPTPSFLFRGCSAHKSFSNDHEKKPLTLSTAPPISPLPLPSFPVSLICLCNDLCCSPIFCHLFGRPFCNHFFFCSHFFCPILLQPQKARSIPYGH